jgi:hypothetical protein
MSQIEQNIHRDLPLMAAWEAGIAAALLLVAAVFAISISQARTTFATEPEIAGTKASCVEGYNALIHQAEGDLIKGDRPATIRSLSAAQGWLQICAVRTTQIPEQ